jgi:hypothetical protein
MALPMSEGRDGLDPRAVEAWWDDRLAEIFTLPGAPHPDRAAAVAYVLGLFNEWQDEAVAIRDVEVWKLHNEHGIGGAALARHLGVSRQRGPQLIDRVAKEGVLTDAKTVVSRVKRRVRAGSRLRVVLDGDQG